MTPTFVQFVSHLGVKLSPAQRVLVLVAFDGVEPEDLTGTDRSLARILFGDVDVVDVHARGVFVAACGARSGKTYILAGLYTLWRSLVADLSTLAPGESAWGLVMAPDLRLARQPIAFVAGALHSSRQLEAMIHRESADSIVVCRPDNRHVTIEALPATYGGGAVRGRSLVSAVLDECAFFRDQNYAINDEDIYRAVAPRLLPGGMVVLDSTTWAEAGLFYEMFRDNHGCPQTALAAHAPTLTMLDTERNREAVAREEARDPENARREFGAVFGVGSKGFFPRDAVERATDVGRTGPLPWIEGRKYWIGFDASDKRDRCACAAVSSEWAPADSDGNRTRRLTIIHAVESWKPVDTADSMRRVRAFCDRFATRHVFLDQYGGSYIRELLLKDAGVRSTLVLLTGGDGPPAEGNDQARAEWSAKNPLRMPKLSAYRAYRDGLISGDVRLPDVPELRHEHAQISIKRTSGGDERIVTPRNKSGHGDSVSAIVLAVAPALTRAPQLLQLTEWEKRQRILNSRANEDIWRSIG